MMCISQQVLILAWPIYAIAMGAFGWWLGSKMWEWSEKTRENRAAEIRKNTQAIEKSLNGRVR